MMAFVLNEWKMQYLDTVPDSNRKILRAFQLIFSERPILHFFLMNERSPEFSLG
jgi:hypothetical protein